MKKKIIISVVSIVVLAVVIVALVIYNNRSKQQESGDDGVYDNMEDAAQNAAFHLDYPDRLGGIPTTGFVSNSSTIEARYGSGNYIRKTLGVADNSGDDAEYAEVSEQNANGLDVTFKGNDGLVSLAVWNDNNFAYTVYVAAGVPIEEMIEYIEMTR